MMTLLRFSWRELVRAKGRFALIALILTIQAAALGGGYIAQESLYHTRDTWSDKLHLADLEVQFVPASAEEMPSLEKLRSIPGVSAVNARFISLGYMERTAGVRLPVVVQYVDPKGHPQVDDIEVLSGRWLEPGKPDVALVDRSFAAAHQLAIGDELIINPHRLTSRFTVGGTGLSPEYLIPTANPGLLVPHKGSLGIVYASREALDRSFPDRLYNDIAVTFRDGADSRAATDAVLAAMGEIEIERVVTKTSTFGYRFLDTMLSGSRSVTPVLAMIVALMAAIVALISVHRLVAERRREIGVLLAQGFAPAQLAACFLGLGLVPGVVGAAVGVPAAMLFASKVTRTTSFISGFPDPIMSWNPKWLAMAAGSSILVGLVSAIPPTLGVLRTRPSQALRGGGEIVFTGLPPWLERVLEARSTAVRYALRNVFRRVRLSLATATLVALAVALPAGLLTSISSWDHWAREEGARLKWDAVVSFKVPLTDEKVAEVMTDKGVAQWDGCVNAYAPVRRADGVTEEMRIRGLPANSDMVRGSANLTGGRWFGSDDAAEAIVNTGFAGARAAWVGEEITVIRKGVSHRLVVVGLLSDAAHASMAVPRGTAQRIFGLEGKSSAAYVRYGAAPAPHPSTRPHEPPPKEVAPTSTAEILEKIDLDEATAKALPVAAPSPVAARVVTDTKSALLENELVTTVEVRTAFVGATLTYLSSFNVIIVPFIGLSGILSFFFLVSVLGFLLIERETEYATLRSMGYATSEIARIVLVEVGVLAAVGLVLSLATWAITAYALRQPMTKTWFWIPLDFRVRDFAVAAVPTLLFLAFAALPGIRALMRLNLSSALRGRGLG